VRGMKEDRSAEGADSQKKTYGVELSKQAQESFANLPADVQRLFARRMMALRQDPRPRGSTKLTGADALYRLRVGDYRMLYEIRDRVLIVLVIDFGHRSQIYRRLR
jgi:mRNA interferase RelE/StbE